MSTAIVDIRAKLKAEIEAQRARLAPSGNRISLQGKVFSLPDGRTSPGPLQLVILDWRVVHSYYTGIYDPAKPQPPVCWAIGIGTEAAPDPDKVAKPRCDTCAACPYNEYGSAAVGKGKACKEYRRVAVAPIDAQSESDIFILDVSPTGITPFERYIGKLLSVGLQPLETLTEVAFKSDATYPTLVFGKGGPLSDEQVAHFFGLREHTAKLLERDIAD